MLSKEMYTDEYIRKLQRRTGNDPALLERMVYALGLLEAISSVGWTFDQGLHSITSFFYKVSFSSLSQMNKFEKCILKNGRQKSGWRPEATRLISR